MSHLFSVTIKTGLFFTASAKGLQGCVCPWSGPSRRLSDLNQLPGWGIFGQLPGAVENGQAAIRISMDLHLDLHIVASIGIAGNLKGQSFKLDAVVVIDRPFVLFT